MAKEPVATVSFVEWGNSPQDGFRDNNQFWGKRVLRCAWNDRITLMRQLNGGYREDETGTWRLPGVYPWNEFARVQNCSATPYPPTPTGSDAAFEDGATHRFALITVNYSVRQVGYQTSEDETKLLEWDFNSTAEFLTRPVKLNQQPTLWWTAPSTTVDREDAPNIPLISTQMTLHIYEVNNLSDNIDNWTGAINSANIGQAYLPTAHPGFGARTFRYDGPVYGTAFTSEGDQRWDVILVFTHRAKEWNKFYRPGQKDPEYMYNHATNRDASDQYLPFDERNLNLMIADML